MIQMDSGVGLRSALVVGAFLSVLLFGSVVLASIGNVPPPSAADIVPGNTAFAFDLFRELQSASGNVFFSPYSISVALAMTYSGARGDTATQMAQALHFGLPQESIPLAFHSLSDSVAAISQPDNGQTSAPVELSVANALWGEQTFTFQQSYLDLLLTSYGAGLWRVDFRGNPDGARSMINQWVSDQTKGKIQDLLGPGTVTVDTRLILTNAIYFLGSWAVPFSPAATGDEPFTLLDGTSVAVPTMHTTEYLAYAQADGLQLVEIPYAGDRLSLMVLLPDAGRFAEMEKTLDGTQFEQLLGQLQSARIALSLPKFRIESQFSLSSALQALGMTDAFDLNRSDFSGMDGARDLAISDVIHKAFVEVNEQGTEAAAATATVMVGATAMPELPIEVKIDRPLLFAIRDRDTGTILFLGRVVDPR